MQKREHSAFTLIELLVVIAIIAILAAILFPVFASARGKARQIACISNEKQIGLGVMQYIQDYDERFPICDYRVGSTGYITWTAEIQPYVKSWTVFICPSDIHPVPGSYHTFHESPTYDSSSDSQEFDSSYGMNVEYLNPDPGCISDPNVKLNGGSGTDSQDGVPVQEGHMDAPSQTVFAVDTKPLMTGNGNQAWAYRHWVDSPALYTIPDACGSWAWGTNNGWDYNQTTEGPTSPGSYGIAGDEQGPTGTDRVSLRHNGGTDVIFCDGHVKWMTPGNLAAGTNWSATTPAGNIVVTDLSKYLWSLRKSGGCDIRIDCNGNNTEENM